MFVSADGKIFVYSNGGSGTTYTLQTTYNSIGTVSLLAATADSSVIAIKSVTDSTKLIVLKQHQGSYLTFQSESAADFNYLAIDPAGNVIVVDQGSSANLKVYRKCAAN